MKRVWIIGASGSGKSTLARELAYKLGAVCVDLDELNWRPNWESVPDAEFRESLERALSAPSWVVASNYTRTKARTLILPHVDTIIWLDYLLAFILWRLVRRIYRRVVRREACCNGNYETLCLTFSRDSVLLWLLCTFGKRRRNGWDFKRESRRQGIRVLHFRRPRMCAEWLRGIKGSA